MQIIMQGVKRYDNQNVKCEIIICDYDVVCNANDDQIVVKMMVKMSMLCSYQSTVIETMIKMIIRVTTDDNDKEMTMVINT